MLYFSIQDMFLLKKYTFNGLLKVIGTQMLVYYSIDMF